MLNESARCARLGWLTPHRQLHRGGPGEAPEVEGSAWLWSLPRCGVLMQALLQARRLVLSTLRRQRFGRALKHVVEGPTRTALRKAGLELGYVLRDMGGRSLLRMQDTAAGTILQLTPAGIEAASAAKSARGKRQRGS